MSQPNYKQMQELCISLLESKGQNYKDWLYEKHLDFVVENSSLVAEALKHNQQKESSSDGSLNTIHT